MKTKAKASNSFLVTTIAIIGLLIFGGLVIYNLRKPIDKVTLPSTDSIEYYKNQYNQTVARIGVIEASSAEALLKLENKKDSELTKLQDLISRYKKELKKPGSSATIIETETVFDTIYLDTVNRDKLVYIDSINNTISNKWITTKYGWKKDSTFYHLKIRDEYDAVIGYDNNKPFADITSHNPYSSVKTIRSFNVKIPPEKKNHFGFNMTLGLDSKLQPIPVVGIGYTYSIWSW